MRSTRKRSLYLRVRQGAKLIKMHSSRKRC